VENVAAVVAEAVHAIAVEHLVNNADVVIEDLMIVPFVKRV